MTKCSRGCSTRPSIGQLNRRITIRRKGLPASTPGASFGEPAHKYQYVLTCWAKVVTRLGVSEYGQVEIGGRRVTHKFIIRYTDTAFDVRDVVELGESRFSILGVENLDEQDRWLIINCMSEGAK